ncbi:tRNA (adenine-N1)-methyltransferase [Methanothermococcus okinawensis]|uniref:tRNA (Adenine-N(1)-)-methyltransferase n=1 Tax=Methanothermococcus okinawensis (strain DSM 14208 / JCM 11175 / IH1) TaxID=647113 RepID=F8ANY4_METOI|nr:tRNA (adenine-N1)-methyltransferase [Methanothermococcus okinawensis]AEH07125.1 tRNA (adenine-N(1)-)-methyltransferase [Methanothermococcus okinawensis IH1]
MKKTKKLIIDERGKKYLIKNEVNKFGNDLGVIDLENMDEGTAITSHNNHTFYLVEPTVYDIVKKMKRSVTTLLPKDIGMILTYCGIEDGETVVEAGTGSGALTIYLANAVGKNGKVITYEKRPEFAKIARKNLEIVGAVKKNQKIIGLEEYEESNENNEDNKNNENNKLKENENNNNNGLYNVIQKIGDITEGIEEKDVDVIVLDMPDPWNVVEHAKNSLNKAKGRIAIYVPYIEQAKKSVMALKEHNFLDIQTVECIVRNIEITEKGARPSTRMIGHTGYIVFARVRPTICNE